jgi:hypothetical protein
MPIPGSATGPRKGRRGRPLKFGRPARAVVLSLPDDVIEWLRSIHHDTAWAIATLFERNHPTRRVRQAVHGPSPPAELVSLPRRRGLIVVEPNRLRNLQGVSLIPLPDGRAFLALDPLKGFADLELAVIDRLEKRGLTPGKRKHLRAFRDQLRAWRRTPGLHFASRSIILAEGVGGSERSRRRRSRRARSDSV